METFHYEPLQLDSNDIRLLRLESSSPARVQCSLAHFRLEDCPDYDALSYTRGPPKPSKIISMDGKDFEIRENLWDFFQHSRYVDGHDEASDDGRTCSRYY
jgi:hypothetical protein